MTHALRVERMIAASPEAVFDAFTGPDGQRAFYAQDDSGWIVQSECDLRAGGRWTISFGASPSGLYCHEHVFGVIERPRRLLLTTTEIRLDGSTFMFEHEFTFEDQDGSTLMTIVQRGFPTVALRDEHAVGVPDALTRFQRVVSPAG